MIFIFRHRNSVLFSAAAFLLAAVMLFFFSIISVPDDFPSPGYVTIQQGSSLSAISQQLVEEKVIINTELFKMMAYLSGREASLRSGTYYFDDPQGMVGVLQTLSLGAFDLPTRKIIVYEGEPAFKFAERLAENFENFSAENFLKIVEEEKKEGYLFPDTYFIPVTSDEKDIIGIFEQNFNRRIAPLQDEITQNPLTLEEIIIKASIIEAEAGSASLGTKKMVAGIINNRLEMGMLLQVDAVFPFIYQKPLPRVLFVHLEVDSPYNTYKYTGLPPGPISNPGIESIKAALNPTLTDSLFYLTGLDGKFYYAKTNAGHEQNRRNYLNYRN